jgi:LIM domain kinase 1
VGGKVSEKQGSLYCEECVVKFAKICEGCMRPIVSRHTVYKRKYYHVECFKCTNCGTSIGKQSFYETSLNDLLCEQCAKGNT